MAASNGLIPIRTRVEVSIRLGWAVEGLADCVCGRNVAASASFRRQD